MTIIEQIEEVVKDERVTVGFSSIGIRILVAGVDLVGDTGKFTGTGTEMSWEELLSYEDDAIIEEVKELKKRANPDPNNPPNYLKVIK